MIEIFPMKEEDIDKVYKIEENALLLLGQNTL